MLHQMWLQSSDAVYMLRSCSQSCHSPKETINYKLTHIFLTIITVEILISIIKYKYYRIGNKNISPAV
jgi:hypothetical protein